MHSHPSMMHTVYPSLMHIRSYFGSREVWARAALSSKRATKYTSAMLPQAGWPPRRPASPPMPQSTQAAVGSSTSPDWDGLSLCSSMAPAVVPLTLHQLRGYVMQQGQAQGGAFQPVAGYGGTAPQGAATTSPQRSGLPLQAASNPTSSSDPFG